MGGVIPVKVTSSTPLDSKTKSKIEAAFRKKHDRENVTFQYSVNPDILGGILINDNDHFYDATVKGQLDKIRHIL